MLQLDWESMIYRDSAFGVCAPGDRGWNESTPTPRNKKTRIQPTLLRVLPFRVGVYLSLLKDVWGSRIIFARPNKVFTQTNKVFTQTNKEQLRVSNHAVYAFDTREQMIEADNNIHKKELRFDSIGKIKTSLYPSPIEDEILQKMGFEPGFDLEKLVDEPEFLMNFVFDDNRNHFCSVHKAIVHIARMRVLLDQDDIGDMVSFRCPECPKCLTCKKSQRSTAVSLQEAREQVIIEQNVRITIQ